MITAFDGITVLAEETIDDIRISCAHEPGSTTMLLLARPAGSADTTTLGHVSLWDPAQPWLTVYPQYQEWVTIERGKRLLALAVEKYPYPPDMSYSEIRAEAGL